MIFFAVLQFDENYNLIQCEKQNKKRAAYLNWLFLRCNLNISTRTAAWNRGKMQTPMFRFGWYAKRLTHLRYMNMYGKFFLSHVHCLHTINYDNKYVYHAVFASHHISSTTSAAFFFFLFAIASLIVYKHAQFSKAHNYHTIWLSSERVCASFTRRFYVGSKISN